MPTYPIEHPATQYRAQALARARANLAKHDWSKQVLDALRDAVSATLMKPSGFVTDMISPTTPGGVGFTNCPECEGNAIHGAYHWDAAHPDQLVCTTCNLVYPNLKYPEDKAFVAAKHGNGQTITYHGGYSLEFHGFHLFSSWTGQIRARKVAYMAGQALGLAKVYALTGERGAGVRACDILLRFAEVYPGYLVHSCYGEWIDLPPKIAAMQINNLPEDEWTLPPNKPDRVLHSGYWNSGRATGLGMEGGFVRQLTVAYDLVHGLLTTDQREVIERDLLRESTLLLLADPALNNKSVTNLTAAGLVGMAIGDPDLVRAGVRGFWHFINTWFLSDGTTSESPAYGLMTLNGLRDFGEALHGYSDPIGYTGEDRLQAVDVYGNAKCRAVFRALYDTLLPDLRYPAWADSYVTTSLGTDYAEILVARYNLPEYRALLGGLLDGEPDTHGGETALWVRDPDLTLLPDDRVVFGDLFYPALRMGFLRTGERGRTGTAILDASHWGVHHHRDSLNLTLFAHGHDMLTDLGYLWDRPDKDMTVRTPGHNLVVVDESEQRTKERQGSLRFYDSTPRVKVIDISSEAYAQCPLYRRLCVWVDHGSAGGYFLDVFDVSGGKTHDAIFHGPVPDYHLSGLLLNPSEVAPYGLRDVASGSATTPWRVTWALDADVGFTVWALPSADEIAQVGSGWGERGWGHFNDLDKRGEIPYVIRRRQGDDLQSRFVSVLDAHKGAPFVTSVSRLGPGVVSVTTQAGTDILALGAMEVDSPLGLLKSNGDLTVASRSFLYLSGGTRAAIGSRQIEQAAARTEGKIVFTGGPVTHFECDRQADPDWVGKTVLVDDGISVTGYPIVAVKGRRIVTREGDTGFDFPGGGGTWQVVHSSLTVNN
jgi:hypothetical protein